ncbi:hypothetical protein NBG84_08150 [Streptomyces sp. CWNU-1]|uniref:Uncharacterized protein n=1 Tax=Streptomyces albipurpureus TaxID=2897419 RepID=A0ABT0ULY3_9ACTN|nr:hypothetical protein [Streptomyces sp. CWNU-1]MCM2388271.1 hypothetical protein [Streptomyces sp. CWNU-1]
MNLSAPHGQFLAIGTPYPPVVTAGYAVQAHGLVERLSEDLDVATENPAPVADITRAVAERLTDR